MFLLRPFKGLSARDRFGSLLLVGALGLVGGAAACGSSGSSSQGFSDVKPEAGIPVTRDSGTSFVVTPSDGGSTSTGPVVASALVFVPPATTITVDGVTPQTTTFQLQATVNGQTVSVSPTSLQFDRPDLGSATIGSPVSVTATGTYGGTGTLHAIFGGLEATATLTIQVLERDLGTTSTTVAAVLDSAGPAGTDAGATTGGDGGATTGADGGATTSTDGGATTVTDAGTTGADAATIATSDPLVKKILYPYNQTVFPLGLTAPIVMWTAPTGGSHANDVYRLQLSEANYTYDGYQTTPLPATSPSPSAAQWAIDQGVWDRVTASNLGPTDPLQVILSRYDAGTMTAAVSATMAWTVAPASLQGAIYYWTASKQEEEDGGILSTGHITRMAPGTGAQPVQLNSGRCMGCHAVSADGTTLVAAIDDPATAPADPPYVLSWQSPNYTRPWAVFDVSQPTPTAGFQSTEYGADIAVTPDGTYTVWGAPTDVPGSKVLSLSSTSTGALVVDSGLDELLGPLAGDVLSMPAFSSDGTMLAAVQSPSSSDNVLPVDPKAIVTVTYSASTQTFGNTLNTVVLATDPAITAGETALAYPSFTPDSKYIAFHAGTWSTGCQGSCDDTTPDDGQLYIAPLSDGGAIRLSVIDDPPNPSDQNASVEPTFDPKPAGGYSWVVFTSLRAWGNMGWPVTTGEDAGANENFKRRLWVAAIDSTIGTVDPSHPPFYLAGQDNTPNMRGFWANAQCIATPVAGQSGGACTQGFQCCSGFCTNGTCASVNTLACQSVGGTCTTATDCCNGGTAVSCSAGGVCTINVTVAQ